MTKKTFDAASSNRDQENLRQLWENAERDRAVAFASELLGVLEDARSFVELVYDDEGGEEAADAKYVLDRIDAASAKATKGE